MLTQKEFRRELRKNQTYAEQKLWSALRNRRLEGRKFRRQHSIGKYTVDFFCHEEKLVIEIDGDSHNNIGSMQYDIDRDDFLTERGNKILRFTNDEIYYHFEEVLNEIKNELSPNPLLKERE